MPGALAGGSSFISPVPSLGKRFPGHPGRKEILHQGKGHRRVKYQSEKTRCFLLTVAALPCGLKHQVWQHRPHPHNREQAAPRVSVSRIGVLIASASQPLVQEHLS